MFAPVKDAITRLSKRALTTSVEKDKPPVPFGEPVEYNSISREIEIKQKK